MNLHAVMTVFRKRPTVLLTIIVSIMFSCINQKDIRSANQQDTTISEKSISATETNSEIQKKEAAHEDDAALRAVAEKIFLDEKKNSEIMKKALTVTLERKNFLDGEFKQSFSLRIRIENTSGKEIKSFVGTLRIIIADDKIKNIPIAYDQGISQNSSKKENFTALFDPLKEVDQLLKAIKLEDLNIVWIPAKIEFADGSTIPSASE